MNKYFSKALFFSERNNYIQASIILSMILSLNLFQFILYKYFGDTVDLNILIDGVFGMLFLIVICVFGMQFDSYNPKEVKYGFLLSQPIKRDAIVITKYLGAVGAVLIPILAYGVIVTAILLSNSQGGLITELWQNILVVSVITLNLTAIMQFFQHIIGKAIAAIITPLIIAFILPITIGILGLLIPSLKNLNPSIELSIMKLLEFLDGVGFFGGIIILTLVAGAILYSSILINRKINYEKTSEIFLFKGVEIGSTWIVSFFIASLIAIAVVASFQAGFGIDLTKGFALFIVNIFVVIVTVGLYKLSYYIKRREA